MDNRLQNIEPIDIHEFQFANSTAFDPGYTTNVYGHGLNNAQAAHSHAQTHFVQDGQVYFDASMPRHQQQQQSPARQLQRQQRRSTVAQKNQTQDRAQTININANIDPTLNGTGAAGSTATATPRTRRARQSQQSTRGPATPASQQQQGQYVLPFTASTGMQSSQTSPSATRHNTNSSILTPSQPGRHAPNGNSRPSSQAQQQQLQTPSSTSMTATPSTAAIHSFSTPNTIGNNSTLADQLTAFNPPSTFDFVPNPPNLQQWRERFFNITEPILLTSEEYHTYFPHVDNIYSHRSTQKYKKKPFVSHYWDCRLKGRPTGQPMPKLLKKRREAEKNNKKLDDGENDADPDQDTHDHQHQHEDDDEEPKEKKKRKRKVRERDLCDVKIKVTEFFGRDELEALGRLGISEEEDPIAVAAAATAAAAAASSGNSMAGTAGSAGMTTGQLTFVLEDGTTTGSTASNNALAGSGSNSGHARMHVSDIGMHSDGNMPFGVLEPLRRFPEGHPGAEGKRWYMVQRVNGSGKDGEPTESVGADLDHKHTLEESDRIKKNSVQRWLLAQEKEKKKQAQRAKNPTTSTQTDLSPTARLSTGPSSASYFASGDARATIKAHSGPASTGLTLFASAFCPFAQRLWIALELKGIPYQFVEILPGNLKDGKCTLPSLVEVNPHGFVPCIRQGNWGVWESNVMMEYLEDLSIGHSLLPLGNPQLRAHCRLWVDHLNRRILPFFYALLYLPLINAENEAMDVSSTKRSILVDLLQSSITDLVNASHATGPFFLGPDMSFVDVAFAPWIIRLSRVLSYYRDLPQPEVGTRWAKWVNAVEGNDCVKRTISDARGYHYVYGGSISAAASGDMSPKCVEVVFARKVMKMLGFGFGDDPMEVLRQIDTQTFASI